MVVLDDWVVEVHPRVFREHPELTFDDVVHSVKRSMEWKERENTEPIKTVGIGPDLNGRILQWVGYWDDDNTFFVYHSMQATDKVYKELGLM